MNKRQLFKLFCILPILALLSISCGGATDTLPRAWIDSPSDGAPIPSGETVTVVSHAYAREGVAEVVLSINGEAYRRDAPSSPGENYVQVSQDWKPTADGIYAVQVQAYDVGGQMSNIASITVRVGGTTATAVVTAMATPVITGAPIITDTPVATMTPTQPEGAIIQFWADPAEVQAGACTSIRWHVENVQRVIFGGIDQSFDGSYEDCLCGDQRYTLTVIHNDGTEEKRTVDIAVSGSCVTPTSVTPTSPPPPQDNTPPSTPSPAVPANGVTLSCRANQNLAWLPVSDPSGIAGYYVALERRASPNESWASAGGSGLIADKQYSVNVECGWYYRWRVSAQDGAGNTSGWSGWSNFAVTLN